LSLLETDLFSDYGICTAVFLYIYAKQISQMNTNTTAAQDSATTQTKVINLRHSLKEEIDVLQGYDESEGVLIRNLLEILDDQLAIALEKVETLPEDKRDDINKTLFHMDTLIKIITTKIDSKLFWAIDNVVYEFKKEKAA